MWRRLLVVRRVARGLGTRVLGRGKRDGSGPLAPPSWAVRSVVLAEVSIRVVDQNIHGRWHRTAPVVDVEGGSFGLEAAGRLATAIDELRTVTAQELGARASR